MLKIQLSLQILWHFIGMQRCAKDYCFILEHIQIAVVVVITVFPFFAWRSVWLVFEKYHQSFSHDLPRDAMTHLVMLRSNKHLMTLNLFTLV